MKKVPYSLLSGIVAVALFFAPFANHVTYAADSNNPAVVSDAYDVTDETYEDVRNDNYGNNYDEEDENVRDDNYAEDDDYDEDVDQDSNDDSDGKWEVQDVTGETYYHYNLNSDTVKSHFDKNGNLKTEKTRSVTLTDDAVKAIKDSATYSTPNGTNIKFPKTVLEQILNSGEDKESLTTILWSVTDDFSNSLSEAIKFSIMNGSAHFFKEELVEPVTITFTVDKEKVNSWEDLTLVYVDQDDDGYGKEKYYPNQVISINPETGEVVVQVHHFSTYYIAEVPGHGAGADVIVKDTGGKGTQDNDTTEKGQGESNKDSIDIDIEKDTDGSVVNGQPLPKTATDTYNILLAGFATLAIGLTTMFIYRRKKAL